MARLVVNLAKTLPLTYYIGFFKSLRQEKNKWIDA
jgi:hypothetical protein